MEKMDNKNVNFNTAIINAYTKKGNILVSKCYERRQFQNTFAFKYLYDLTQRIFL